MNPILHAILFILAVIVPGGLLVYFAWSALSKKKKKGMHPEEIIAEFRKLYPLKKSADRKRIIPRKPTKL